MKLPIYTIGHGNRKREEFLVLLNKFGVKYIVDIRSVPFSRYKSQFNQIKFKEFLESSGLRYVFMGDTIGGVPKDISCYMENGKVDYEAVRNKPFFIGGIERLKTAYHKNIPIVLMCSEANPCECHRSKLIGRALSSEGISVEHIDEKGELKSQASVIYELNRGFPEYDLFGNLMNSTSEKGYFTTKEE